MKGSIQSNILNEFKLNENYSNLKDSCKVLYKELSTMREKNESLKQKVNELESTLSSIGQRTITKEEMKDMIKEGLTPIVDVLIGKETETVDAETQTEDIINTTKPFNLYKQTLQQHPSWVTFILELLDGRIAVSCWKGSISLNQMNYQIKE